MSEDLYEALRRFAQNSKLFSLLDSFGLERLARSGSLQHFEPETVVVRQGDPGDRFYLIIAGEVRVLVEEAGGEVARLKSGNFFGEIGVLTKQTRSATVETVGACEMIAFEREPVLGLLEDYPRVKEVVGTVGLLRSEENLDRASADGDGGLASLLEGKDEAAYDDDDVELEDDLLTDADTDGEEGHDLELEVELADAPQDQSAEERTVEPADEPAAASDAMSMELQDLDVGLELDPGPPETPAAPAPGSADVELPELDVDPVAPEPPAETPAEMPAPDSDAPSHVSADVDEIELDLDFDLGEST